MSPKPAQLRVMPISPRLSRKNSLGEQRFAPDRDKSFRIEVTRMNGPEPHYKGLSEAYSDLSVTTGSTRVARSAGTSVASSATAASSAGVPRNVTGSVGPTP